VFENFYNKIISLEHILKEKFQSGERRMKRRTCRRQRVPVNGRKKVYTKQQKKNFKIPKCGGIYLSHMLWQQQHNKCFNFSQKSSVFDRTSHSRSGGVCRYEPKLAIMQ
jgi:hypothetical protein